MKCSLAEQQSLAPDLNDKGALKSINTNSSSELKTSAITQSEPISGTKMVTAELASLLQQTPQDDTTLNNPDRRMLTPQPQSSTPRGALSLVIARSGYIGTKSNQLSFAKGDLIEVVSTNGKWHVGILKKSSSYGITGQRKYFPPNYVRPFRL